MLDLKQRTILNGLVADGFIHSWAVTYDSVDEALDGDAWTFETLPWWLLADDWDR